MAKYFVGESTYSLEAHYNGLTHGQIDRLKENEVQTLGKKEAVQMLRDLWNKGEPKNFPPKTGIWLMRSSWFLTRKSSRTSHLERETVKSWGLDEFLEEVT